LQAASQRYVSVVADERPNGNTWHFWLTAREALNSDKKDGLLLSEIQRAEWS
jgi:hypothetical protein